MPIEIASVSIPTQINLFGFNSGIKTLERTKIAPIGIDIRFNTKSLERDRRQLEATLAKPLVLTVEVDDSKLTAFERRLADRATHKIRVDIEIGDINAQYQQIERNLANIPSLKLKVDDSELTKANEHIEAKRTHVKDVNLWMRQNALKVSVDTKPVEAISKKVTAVEKQIRTVNQAHKATAVSATNDKLRKYEPKIISSSDVSNQIEKAFSQAKPKLGSGVFSSILKGGLEKIGSQLTSGFSEGLSNSINDAISGSIGSFDLLGRSIFDKVIPSIFKGINKAPIAKALTKTISQSKVGQTAREALKATRGVIGEDEIAIEQRINKSRRRTSGNDRNQVAAKEFGIEYEQALSKSGINQIEQAETEKQIKQLTKQRSQAQRELNSFMSMTLDERVIAHFDNQINSTSANIKRLQSQQKQLESEAQKLVDKMDSGVQLSGKEQARQGVIESQYAALEKQVSAAQSNLEGFSSKRQNIATASDEEKEALTGAGIKGRMDRISEVEKQLENARKRLETIATEKTELERLLGVVGIKGAGKLEGARALRDTAISQKRLQISSLKAGHQEKIDKAQQVLEASQTKIDKAKIQLQQAVAGSEDAFAEGLRQFIDKEQKRQVQVKAGISELAEAIENLDKNEISFIERANKSVPTAEFGVIQEAGIDKSIQQIGKDVAFGNVENISTEYKNLLDKLKNLEFESNAEMKAAIERMEVINVSIGDYEKQADDAFKELKAAGKGNAQSGLSGQVVGAMPPKSKLPKNAIPQTYRSLVEEVTKASGVKVTEAQIPKIQAWSPKQIQSLAAKGISAEAAYVAEKNMILVKQEQLDQLMSGQVSPELVENIVHELRHSVQNAFGQIDPHKEQRSAVELMRPNAKEMQQIGNLIEVSTSNAYDASPQEESFIRKTEQDAYTFALRNTDQIYNKVARPAKVQKIEQVAGAGGFKLLGNIDKLQAQQADKLGKSLQGAVYDVSSAESKLGAKFSLLRKAAEKYISQVADIDALSDADLGQLEQDIQRFAEQSTQIASKFSDAVEKELFDSAKSELQGQLQGGGMPKPELQKLARSFGVGIGGTKEEITKRLMANVDFSDLRLTVPEPTKEQRAAIAKADVLVRQPDSIRENISASIADNRAHLNRFKEGMDFESPIPNLEQDYGLVLELLSRNLEKDIKKYLQGAKLQIGNLRKASMEAEEALLAAPDIDTSADDIDTSGLQLSGRSINPLEAARQRLRQVTNNFERNKATQANARANEALQQVFSAGMNKQENTINKAISEFDKAAQLKYQAAVKAVEQRISNYDAAILKADELVFELIQPENKIATNEAQKTFTENNRLLSEQEAKGNVVNYQRLSIPKPVDEDTGEFKQLVGEALGDFFSGVAERVRKQAVILENEVPSLMTDLSVSAMQAGTEEASQLTDYKTKLESLMNESRELSVKSTLTPEEVQRLSAINQEVQGVFDTFGRTVPKVNQFFDALFTGGNAAAQAGSMLKNLAFGFLSFKTLGFAIDTLKQFAPALIDSAMAMESLERRFGFVSGGFAEGAKNLEFVRSEVKRLGTDVKASMEGFTSLAGATRDTSLEGEATRQIFSGVSQASTVYDLNAEQQGRVFTAVQQMASKGKVSSEELRQQLGESLPGAFQIAARAMGVTTQQLNKMLEKGEVISEDFLPKFAQQLSAETSSGVAGAANSSVSALIGFNNTVFETQAALGKQLLPARNFGLSALSGAMTLVKDNAEILMSVIQFLVIVMGVNAAKSAWAFISGLKMLGGQALLSAGGLQTLGVAAKGALSAAAPMVLAFVGFKVVSQIFEKISFSFSDAGGAIRNFADTSKKGLGDFRQALKEAKGEQQDFNSSFGRQAFEKKAWQKDQDDDFIANITGANFIRKNVVDPLMNPRAILKKEQKDPINLGDRFNALTKGFSDMAKPKAIKILDDKVAATKDAIAASNERIGLSQGTEVQGVISQVQGIDKQLKSVQMKRRAVVLTNPKDVDSLKQLKAEEENLLKNRERLYKPIGSMQSQYQADIDGLKAALEEFEQLRKTGDIDDVTYTRETTNLKTQLEKAEKAQKDFNRAVGENINAVALLGKQFQDIADKLADASSAAQIGGNRDKAALYANPYLSTEQRALASEQIDTNVLEQQTRQTSAALREQIALLMTPENVATLQEYGVNKDTGAAQLKTLAERAGDDSPDAKLFEKFQQIKEQELQFSELQNQLAQRKAEAQQRFYELNKQVEEYYRGIARQAAESKIQLAQQVSEVQNQQFANQINMAMLGVGDNIISQFVGSLLDSITQIAQAADTDLNAQSQILQAQNAFEDTFRSGEELRRQLPALSASGDLPKIPVEIDLSSVAANSDVRELNTEIKGSVSATQDLENATQGFNTTVADSGSLLNANTDATNGLESAISSVGSSVDNTVQSTDNLNTAVSSTADSATYLQSQIDANTMSVDQTNASMQGVGTAIDVNTQKTAIITEQSKGWWTELLNAQNIGVSIQGVFTNLSAGLMDMILKTVDWFKTMANNFPILNQIGQTISGFGQGLAATGQAVADGVGGAIQQGGNLVNQGVGAVQGILGMGKGVGKIGGFNIVESVGRSVQKVNSFRDLEKHHPSSGRERGRSYETIDGELEEIRKTKDGRTLIKKDFVLSKNGSQNVDIPAFAEGYVKRLNDSVNTVQIYQDKAMTKLIGQSLHMNNVPVKTGDFVRYGQSIGKQSGAGGFATHAHLEMQKELFEKYVADLKSGNFAGITGKVAEHSLGDGHNHFGEEDVKKANQGVASVTGSAQSMLASMGGGEKAGSAAPGQNSIVRMRRTGQLDNKGLEKLAVDVVNSQGQVVKSFTANSGKANMQKAFGGAGTTRANSNAPLEYGKYDIGAATAGLTPAVGKTFVPIEPQFKTARSSLGIHWDADRPVGAGSAGCIVFATEAEFKAFQAAIKANGVNSLVFEGQGGSNKAPKTMAPPQVQQQAAPQAQARTKGGVLWGKAGQYAPSDLSGLTERGKQAVEALKNPRVRAFLDAVSAAELGDQAAAKGGYGYLFGDTRGKETFNPNAMKAHPRRRVPFGKSASSATGRYQTMDFVWDEEHGRLGLKDMKPQAQEIMAVSRLMYRKILPDIMSGNIQGALNKPGNFDASSEWASIQGNPYKQGTGGGKVSTFLANYQKAFKEAVSSGGSPPMPQQQAAMMQGAPTPQGQAFIPAPTMQVWTPQSVSQAGNARITEAQNIAATQRDEQQRVASQQALLQAESGSIQALQKGFQSLSQVEKQLRQSGYETRDLFEDVEKMTLESLGPLSLPEQRKQRQQELQRQFRDSREKVGEKIIDVQNRQKSAKAILDQPGGIISPAMREKFEKLISMPISEDLKAKLQEAMTTGMFGDQLRSVLQRSVTQGEKEIATLQKASKALETGEQSAMKAAKERFDFEEKARANAAKFEQESLNIGTLQAQLEQVRGQAERDPFGGYKEQATSIESLIGLRQQQLDYEKQLQEIEGKVRNKDITEQEAEAQRKSIGEKKKITDKTIQENKAYQDLMSTRAKDTRNREASFEATRSQLAVQKQQLEGLKALPTTDPARAGIPMLEYQIELSEIQLKLQEDIAAVNEQVFKKERTDSEGQARIATLKAEYELNVQNLGVRQKQATTEQQLAQQRAILGIREQELGFSEQLLEAQTRAIELGRQSGDTLGDRFGLQKQQQELGFEKELLNIKELATQSGASTEELSKTEAKLRQINEIKLSNIQAEMDKAFADRSHAINQRVGESTNSVLGAKQSLMSTMGFGMEANRLGKQIAVNEQGMNFTNQRKELEEFIKTNNVASNQATKLRSDLESVNDIKFREIQAQFNPLKGVIDSTAGAMKGAFKSLIKDGKVDFDSFFDGILDSIAEFLSNMLVEQLMGFLSPDKDKKKGGGMFPDATADPNAQPGGMEFSGILGGLGGETFLGGELGTTPMAPMYVSAVNGAMGFAAPANNIVPFNSPGFGGSFASGLDSFGLGINSLWGGSTPGGGQKVSSSLFSGLGGLFDGGQNFTATNPLPVNMTQAKPNLFSSFFGGGGAGGGGNFITNALGMLTGGGGAAKPGGGGGFSSIISMVLPMLTGFLGFAEGGVIGSGKSKKDDQIILAQRGEGILTHDGMRAIGGAAALNALNRGGYVPKFATGGTVGGEYGVRGADAVERGHQERQKQSSEPIKVESQVINSVEYVTMDQAKVLANDARNQGARDGAKFVTNKMQNSPTFRNRYRL